MNINFDTDTNALLYHMHSKFRESDYGCNPKPILSWADFKANAPLINVYFFFVFGWAGATVTYVYVSNPSYTFIPIYIHI